MICHHCGAKIADNARFCDSCGTQTAAERAAIQEQQKANLETHRDKSVSGSVWITVAMVVFSLLFIIFIGFEEGAPMVMTVTAIVFSTFMIGLKWFFEIRAQRRWHKQAQEKAQGSDRHAL